MSEKYFIQRRPFIVPAPDNKIIKEHFGHASKHVGDFSIAHMIAPAGWSEPAQTPDFDEITIMVRGKKQIDIDDEKIVIKAGESIFIRRGTRVRYANPFDEENEYIAICTPAFTLEAAHREV